MELINWLEKILRHGYGIDPQTATHKELEEYVATKIYVHIQENFTDYTL